MGGVEDWTDHPETQQGVGGPRSQQGFPPPAYP